SALTMSNGFLMEQDLLQVNREATLNRGQTAGPSDVFATRDGHVMCSVIGGYQFKRWCELVEAPDLAADARFKDDDGRGRHGEVLSARMAEWCSSRTNEEALAAMAAAKIPAGPVYSPQQALDDDHIAAIGALADVEYPTSDRPAKVTDFPVRMSADPGGIQQRAPLLGEHTDDVLGELGYTPQEIAELRANAVI
ncbi:MAG: CoA transferase, partial [Actinomycetota bacterium]